MPTNADGGKKGSHPSDRRHAFSFLQGDKKLTDATFLELDKPIERELSGDQAHSYSIKLSAGQYLYVVVDQRGIDVVVSLFGPGGKKLSEVDSPNGKQGPEPVSMIVETTGDYRLEVRSLEKAAAAGRYEVKLEELRTATEKDKDRIAADQAFAQAVLLRGQGTTESLQGAVKKYEEALPVYRSIGDPRREAQTLSGIGMVYYSLGERQKALGYLTLALPLSRAIGDSTSERYTLHNIGFVYDALGEKQKALDYYAQALPLFRAIGDQSGEAQMLNNIGAVYYSLGEKQKALDYYNQALPLRRAVNDRRGEVSTLTNLGAIYYEIAEKRKALEYFNHALSLSREVGDRGGEAKTLGNIAKYYSDQGERAKAAEYLNQTLALSRALGDRESEGVTLAYLADIYAATSEAEKALDFYNQALALSRSLRNPYNEASTLYGLAVFERDRGRLDKAGAHIEYALNIVESQRLNLTSQSLRSSYFATVQKYYEFYIDLLMQLHKPKPSEGYDGRALQARERGRARSLLETLAEANADIRQGVDPDLLTQERALQQQLNAKAELRVRLLNSKHTGEQAMAAATEIEALTTEYQEVEAKIRETSPRYAALTQPQPLSLKEIQTKILEAETVLLEYSLGAERSYLWVVTRDALYSYQLPRREAIEAAGRAFYNAISVRPTANPAAKRVYDKAAATLSDILLKPATVHIRAGKRLLIVGDGILQYIPFAALPEPQLAISREPRINNKALIAAHEIISLPSASTVSILRDETRERNQRMKAVAVLADPVFELSDFRLKDQSATNVAANNKPSSDRAFQTFLRTINGNEASGSVQSIPRLPYTRREALSIASLVPQTQSKVFLDFDASYDNATSPELGNYRFLHIATHGLLDTEHPELSGILFSLMDRRGRPQPQALLRLGEIYNLKLPVEMVVLSGCQTAIGKEIKGEGLIGLSRGFMYAGSPRVVASLWKIDDAKTADMMKHFYEAMLGPQRLAPAAALRQAQRRMWQQKIGPFYWAAFIMQGEWR